ncbi:MAG: HAD-IA family hydrolase [Alphaproteobacteria bacterium]|nr:HAD-IA family hydrolase [Alphaproteobacteria bacterium]
MTSIFPRAVIFDWDNTLVDSWGAISEAVNFARARYGLPTWNREEILANCTRSAREAFPDWFGDKWEQAWGEYYDYFVKVRERMGINQAHGATELLEWLKQNNIPAMVVSNKSGTHLRQEAVHLDWNKYFASIVGAHDAPCDKPAREHADKALTLAGLEGGADIWFIGDSETDVACARNAECTPVLIGAPEKARRLNVEIHFPDCRAVVEYLKNIAKPLSR